MNRLQRLLGVCAIALTTIGCNPSIKEVKDLTGDGIKDIHMTTSFEYLFIGQKDGTYIRAIKKSSDKISFYQTDQGETYFFDGEFYRKSVK